MKVRVEKYTWSEVKPLATSENIALLAGGFFTAWTPKLDGPGEELCIFMDTEAAALLTEKELHAVLLHEEGHAVFDGDLLKNSVGVVVDFEIEHRADLYAIENGARPEDLFAGAKKTVEVFFSRTKLQEDQKALGIKNTIALMRQYPYYQGIAA